MTHSTSSLDRDNITFSINNVGPIVSRDKWVTARIKGVYDFTEGEVRDLITPEGWRFAIAMVDKVSTMELEDFYQKSPKGHKRYESIDHAVESMDSYYESKTVTKNTELDVVWLDDVIVRGGKVEVA